MRIEDIEDIGMMNETKAEWDGTKVAVEYKDTDGETHVVTGLSVAAAVESVGHRGPRMAMENDPLAGLWTTTDKGKLATIKVGVSPLNSCGEFVRFAFSTLYSVS